MVNRLFVLGFIFLSCNFVQAQVTKFEVLSSTPAFEGRSFGVVGGYTKIVAKATIALDPKDKRNAMIADIDLAPRDAKGRQKGRVQAVADVVILRPTDSSKANGTLLLDVLNRGNKLALQLFDDSVQPGSNLIEKAADAGIGFAMRSGYTYVWVGWQADIASQPNQLALAAPALLGTTGKGRDEFQFDHLRNPATATLSWAIADPASLMVTVRAKWDDARSTPAGLSIKATGAKTVEITRPTEGGFDAGALYEVTYTAKDPWVAGLGFAATRDVVSFLKHDTTSRNPLMQSKRNSIQRSIGFGVSQSGRFLREFLYLGFNEDTKGRIVFEGLMPHVAGARRIATNYRFGLTGRNARHPQDPAWQNDLFPFTYAALQDPLSGKTDGLLLRCTASKTCPKVIQTDSEHEWWASRASLLVTNLDGSHLDLPTNVRAYMIAGTPHYAEVTDVLKTSPIMSKPVNPMHAGAPMRALLSAMQAWITAGQEPPASRVPMRAHGTLVQASDAVRRDIPQLPYIGTYTGAGLADQSIFPPKVMGYYPVFVPRADSDAMSIAGIRMLPLAVPKATYTGWNQRAQGYGASMLYPLQGAVVPFAATQEERMKNGDPRLSLAERYIDHGAYVAAVKAAAAQMVAERLMLPEDAERAAVAAQNDKLSRLQ